MKYTKEQIEFVLKERSKGTQYTEIAKKFKKLFKVEKSVDALEKVHRRHKNGISRRAPADYTAEQISYVLSEKAKGKSYRDIIAGFFKKFKVRKSKNALESLNRRYKDDPKIKVERPKVLIYDIETAPMLGYCWSLWDQNIGLNQIESDWYVLSWSAKWLDDDDDQVMYMDQRKAKNIEDDKKLLEAMWKLLDECDIVITQNGKKFDQKKLNARFILNGMQPPSSYKHIDTRQIAKRYFGFTSNNLNI